MGQLIDFVLHIDRHLLEFVQQYGTWVYGILFAIVFAETGLVVTPFLPGDSLLFAVGAFARDRRVEPLAVLRAAAGGGDSAATPSTTQSGGGLVPALLGRATARHSRTG